MVESMPWTTTVRQKREQGPQMFVLLELAEDSKPKWWASCNRVCWVLATRTSDIVNSLYVKQGKGEICGIFGSVLSRMAVTTPTVERMDVEERTGFGSANAGRE